MQVVYALLCLSGAVAPLSQFVPWLVQHGLALPLLAQQAFASPVSAFAWLDVLVSAVVMLVFVAVEGRRLRMPPPWLPVLCLATVGVSLALPMFLLLRERHLAAAPGRAHAPPRGQQA